MRLILLLLVLVPAFAWSQDITVKAEAFLKQLNDDQRA